MNVFILCSGRCGSVTLAKAFQHAENYSTGHESRSGLCGRNRVNYPADHIEADPRLAWFLGRLDREFGDKAFYVHLTRDKAQVIASFAKKKDRPAMGAMAVPHFAGGMAKIPPNTREAVREYVETVNENISLFLKDKPNQMGIQIDRIAEQFPILWERIGAQGNINEALWELTEKHNAS
jgi:hypothetical protein